MIYFRDIAFGSYAAVAYAKDLEDSIDKKDDQIRKLKEQIEAMKCRGNCANDFEIKNNTSCPLYDFQDVKCPCDKYEIEGSATKILL